VLIELQRALQERGVRLVAAELDDDVRRELRIYGIEDAAGSDAFFSTVQEALEAYRAAMPST
jgi:MFS superfamily sulfate permease-like transporter